MSDLVSETDEHIVVAVGPNAHAALAYATAEAMRNNLGLRLVHVVEPTSDPEELERLTTIGDYRLHVAVSRVQAWTFGRQATTRAVVEGSVAHVLLIASRHAEMIVLERPDQPRADGPSVRATLATEGTTPFVLVPNGWSSSTASGPLPMRLGVDAVDWPAAARAVATAPAPVLVVPTERRQRHLAAVPDHPGARAG